MKKTLALSILAMSATQVMATGIVNLDLVQDSANSVARPTSDKLANFVNVKDQGAKCDGSADDTATIQAAIKTVGKRGGTVQLPSGICMVSSVNLASNVTLVGQGNQSTIKRIAGASTGAVLKGSGLSVVTLANLTVDGNSSAAIGNDSNIYIVASNDILIDGVRSINSLLHGISIQSSTDKVNHTISSVRNSVVKNTLQYGIEAQDAGRIVIENNRIAKTASYGILVYGTSQSSVQSALITGNFVVEAGGSGIAIPFINGGTAITSGVEEVTVTGNVVETSALNGYVIQGRLATVTGNSASRNGTQISHQGFVINAVSVTVTGNTATRNAGVGIDFGDCKHVIASGNLVEENGIIGIEINSTEDFVITGNVVVNNNQNKGAGALAAGILAHHGTGGYAFTGKTMNGAISNNIVRSGPYQRFGIKLTADTDNVRMLGNDALAAGSVRDYEILAPTGHFIQSENSVSAKIVTPASTLTVPQVGQSFFVSGGAQIDSIVTDSGSYEIGRLLILRFTGATTVANATGNVYLNGSNFIANKDSLLVLVRSDESGWLEVSRRYGSGKQSAPVSGTGCNTGVNGSNRLAIANEPCTRPSLGSD
jgi:parallel beta-helix repeat protein